MALLLFPKFGNPSEKGKAGSDRAKSVGSVLLSLSLTQCFRWTLTLGNSKLPAEGPMGTCPLSRQRQPKGPEALAEDRRES